MAWVYILRGLPTIAGLVAGTGALTNDWGFSDGTLSTRDLNYLNKLPLNKFIPPSKIYSNQKDFNPMVYMGRDYEQLRRDFLLDSTKRIPEKMDLYIEQDFRYMVNNTDSLHIDPLGNFIPNYNRRKWESLDESAKNKWKAFVLYFIPDLMIFETGYKNYFNSYDEMVFNYADYGDFYFSELSAESAEKKKYIKRLKDKIQAYLFGRCIAEKRTSTDYKTAEYLKPPFAWDVYKLYFKKHSEQKPENFEEIDYEAYHLDRNFDFIHEKTAEVLYNYCYFQTRFDEIVARDGIPSEEVKRIKDQFGVSNALQDFYLVDNAYKDVNDRYFDLLTVHNQALKSLGLYDRQNGGIIKPNSTQMLNPFYWIFLLQEATTSNIYLKLMIFYVRSKLTYHKVNSHNPTYGDALISSIYNYNLKDNLKKIEFDQYTFKDEQLLQVFNGPNFNEENVKTYFHALYRSFYYYHSRYSFFHNGYEIDQFYPYALFGNVRTIDWPITLGDYFTIKTEFEMEDTFFPAVPSLSLEDRRYKILSDYVFNYGQNISSSFIISKPTEIMRKNYERVLDGRPEIGPTIPDNPIIPRETIPWTPLKPGKEPETIPLIPIKEDNTNPDIQVNTSNTGGVILIGGAVLFALSVGGHESKKRKLT